jgi:hypothetical protein
MCGKALVTIPELYSPVSVAPVRSRIPTTRVHRILLFNGQAVPPGAKLIREKHFAFHISNIT